MSDLTPQEDRVRRLLASARHDGPMPPRVADRLDRVLASLREHQPPGAAGAAAAPGTPAPARMASHASGAKPLRHWRSLVLAAAIVVIAGVGVTVFQLSKDNPDQTSAGKAPSTTARPSGAVAPTPTVATPFAGGGDRSEASNPTDPKATAPVPLPVRLDSAGFPVQVRTHLAVNSGGLTPPGQAGSGQLPPGFAGCDIPATDDPKIPATYDGRRGFLVVRQLDGGRRVDLYLCGSTQPLRSVTVPSP